MLTTAEDLRYPETAGHRSLGTRLFSWYTGHIIGLSASDPGVTAAFFQVQHLLKPLVSLLEPRIVWAVLKHELSSYRQKSIARISTDEADSSVSTRPLDAVAR
jgi:hypothetical protein